MLLILLFACQTDPKDRFLPESIPLDESAEPNESSPDDSPEDSTQSDDSSAPDDSQESDPPTDADGDGYDSEAAGGDDCDDADPDVHPGAFDVAGNGVDDDCDGIRGPTMWTIFGSADELFGIPMSPGDVDGDGIVELAVGAGYAYDNGGAVYLFSGANLEDNLRWTDADAVFIGAHLGDDARTGSSPVRAAGDLDGDGVAELGYGAQYEDVGSSNTGAYFLWSGGPHLSGTLQSGDADLFLYDSDSASEHGYAAAGVGDVDGDGYSDLAVGSPRGGNFWNGRAWLISGSALLTASGQVDVTTLASGALAGESYSVLGWDIAERVDLDDDGHPDLVTSAYYGAATQAYYGAVEVAYGPVNLRSPNVTADGGTIGASYYGFFGSQIVSGDLDWDGFTDLVASAPAEHATYVRYGDGARWGWDTVSSTAAGCYSGEGLGAAVAIADFDGDAGDDLALVGHGPNGGTLYLIRGGGRVNINGQAPSAVAAWISGTDGAALDGGVLAALPDLPNPGRPAFVGSANGKVILMVQLD